MAKNKVVFGNQTLIDLTDTTAEAADVAAGEVFYDRGGNRTVGTGNYMEKVANPTDDDILITDVDGQAVDSGVKTTDFIHRFPSATQNNIATFDDKGQVKDGGVGISDIATKTYVDTGLAEKADTSDIPGQATDTTLGTVKLNPDQSITLNANGQLEVGGRMGQFPTTTGMYAPNNRDPRNVGNYSFLITDAMGMDLNANRSMAVVSGLGLTCRSAAAGSTEYRIQNNYANRIQAILCAGGYAARDEATSTTQRIVQVVSVTINGSSYIPDSSANPSGTASDIVIKTAETLNPDTAITNIRLFGKMGSYATLHAGNGIASESGGRNLLLGGGVTKSGSSNDNCLVGNGIYSSGNGNACFGRYHIARKNRGFFAGTGHDSTNAPSEGASAVGQYSYMDSGTLFAVGNGSSHTARSNAFEVTSDGGVVLKSPNGTRWKLTVDNNGNLSTTAL